MRHITLILFFLLTTLFVRTQSNVPAENKYLHFQRLLKVEDDSVKCVELISYAAKIMDSLADYNFALLVFEKTNAILHQNRFSTLWPKLYSKWGYCLYLKGDFEAANKFYSKALDHGDVLNVNPALKAEILNRTGTNLQKLMIYKRAIICYNEALELYTKLNNELGKALVYSNMATISSSTGNHAQADELMDKAAQIYLENKKMDKYASVVVNKAIIKARLKKFNEARSILLSALNLIPKKNHKLYISACTNLGLVYADLKQWDSCFYFLNRGKALSDSANLSEQLNGHYYHSMASAYADKKELSKAIGYYKLALKNRNGIADYRTLYDDISDTYFENKQYDSAFLYKNESMRIADSIYKTELNEHISFENKRIELLEKDYQSQIRATQQEQFLSNLEKRNFMLLCIVIILITLVLLLFLYFKQYRLRLKKEQLQSELDFLKAQLNPHFLFNSLNNIYVLLEEDKDKALELLIQFCELLRYQLYDCDVSSILLTDELRFLENYVDFEKLRYGKKINVEHNLKETFAGDIQIAPILLQPFIENAFKHSPKNRNNPSQISIYTALTEDGFSMEVKNSVNTKEKSTLPGGIGLENVKKRLKLLYPNKHDLKINATDAFFQIRLKILLSDD